MFSLLDLLLRLMILGYTVDGFNCHLLIRTENEGPDYWSFLVTAKTSDLVAFAQQLAWLTAWLREPKPSHTSAPQSSEVSFIADRSRLKEFRIASLPLRPLLLTRTKFPLSILPHCLVISNFLAEEPQSHKPAMMLDVCLLPAFVTYVLDPLLRLESHVLKHSFPVNIFLESRFNDENRTWVIMPTPDLNKSISTVSRPPHKEEDRFFSELPTELVTTGFEQTATSILLTWETLDVCLAVHWNFHDYCMKNLDGKREISRVPVLVGCLENSFAGTCGEYFELTWPQHAKWLLDFLEKNFDKNHETGMSQAVLSPLGAIYGRDLAKF